jgi:hypothetical protein
MNEIALYFTSPQGFISYLFSLFFILCCFITGSFFIPANGTAKNVFRSLLAGLLILTIGFAIWRTAGISVLMLSILPLFSLAWYNRRSIPKRFSLPPPAASLIIAIAAFLFSVKCYLLFPWQQLIPDHAFYSRISYFISKTGIENEFHHLNLLNPVYHGISPYHYFELWLNGLLSFIRGNTSLVNYLTITMISLDIIVLFALLAIAERNKSLLNLRYAFYCILILFASSINIFEILNLSALKDFSYIYSSIIVSNEIRHSYHIVRGICTEAERK